MQPQWPKQPRKPEDVDNPAWPQLPETKRTVFTPRQRHPVLRAFGFPTESQAKLNTDIESIRKKIEENENKLFDLINLRFNWDDPDRIPGNVDEMMVFLKRHSDVVTQINKLFWSYYQYSGRENPLTSIENDKRHKDLIKIAFLIKFIRDDGFGFQDKYEDNDITVESLNRLITLTKTQSIAQQQRQDKRDAATDHARLGVEESEAAVTDLEEQIELETALGSRNVDRLRQDVERHQGKATGRRTKYDRLRNPYGGKRKKKTCKKRIIKEYRKNAKQKR